MPEKYHCKKQPAHQDIPVRALQYRIHTWGDPSAKPVFLLHGWVDTGMSFQFLADAMSAEWFLIAPDWRGFGDTHWCEQGYWFPDYIADLDVILDHYAKNATARLVGHSMGGNITWLYAGIKPERISHAVSLEAFGLPVRTAGEAPGRYADWLNQLKTALSFSSYDDLEQIVATVIRLAPYIPADKARFIAEQWSRASDDGRLTLKADPAHKRINPVLYRREEARACWRNITARTMLVLGAESGAYKRYYQEGYEQDCRECFNELREVTIKEAGHMLHLERPQELSATLEKFLRD